MQKILLAIAAGTATTMFLSGPVGDMLMKVDFIKDQSAKNQKLYQGAITGGLGALVAVLVVNN